MAEIRYEMLEVLSFLGSGEGITSVNKDNIAIFFSGIKKCNEAFQVFYF